MKYVVLLAVCLLASCNEPVSLLIYEKEAVPAGWGVDMKLERHDAFGKEPVLYWKGQEYYITYVWEWPDGDITMDRKKVNKLRFDELKKGQLIDFN